MSNHKNNNGLNILGNNNSSKKSPSKISIPKHLLKK
jgi:hypothetical protein